MQVLGKVGCFYFLTADERGLTRYEFGCFVRYLLSITNNNNAGDD